jgi:hypothetical protein
MGLSRPRAALLRPEAVSAYVLRMSSTLACAGLPTSDEQLAALLEQILPETQLLGAVGRNRVVRWEDPSGARLVLEVGDDGVVDLLPSFRSGPTVLLGDLESVNRDVVSAWLLDEDGDQLTHACLAIEQRRLLSRRTVPRVRASLTALGVEVTIHPDEEAFAASDASLLDPDAPPSQAPPEYEERGWTWPPRVSATSFFSYGVFAEAPDATPHARLSGPVLRAERRIVQATGKDVVVADVDSVGGRLTVCLEGADHSEVPAPGSILTGTVYLTASLEELPPAPRRRFWSRRA